MPQSKYTKRRLKFIDEAETQLAGGIKQFQSKLWDRIEKTINKLSVDEGKITGNAGNYTLLGELNRIGNELRGGPKKDIIKSLINNLLEQESLVKDYFSKFLKLNRSAVETKVHKQLLNRIGYDGDGFVNRGVLHDLWTDDTDIRAIRAQTVKAIAGGQSWQEFQTQMKVLVNGEGDKPGISEAHFRTVTRDMYAQNDRALTKHYADEYELDKFIFQGGLMNTTRDFCRARNNRIFTRKEIEEWSGLSWQGKPKVYDPFLDVGGINCRHVLDALSDELAKELEGDN